MWPPTLAHIGDVFRKQAISSSPHQTRWWKNPGSGPGAWFTRPGLPTVLMHGLLLVGYGALQLTNETCALDRCGHALRTLDVSSGQCISRFEKILEHSAVIGDLSLRILNLAATCATWVIVNFWKFLFLLVLGDCVAMSWIRRSSEPIKQKFVTYDFPDDETISNYSDDSVWLQEGIFLHIVCLHFDSVWTDSGIVKLILIVLKPVFRSSYNKIIQSCTTFFY